MAGRQTIPIEVALNCAKCGASCTFVEECTDPAYSPGEILLMQCPTRGCKEKPWFYCNTCKRKCYRNGLSGHASRKMHIQKHASVYPPLPAPPPDPPAAKVDPVPAFPGDNTMGNFETDNMAMDEAVMEATDEFIQKMENELAAAHVENATSCMGTITNITPAGSSEQFTTMPQKGNEWLAEALKDVPRATFQEMHLAFASPQLQHMKNFYMAELGSGEGKSGGGIMYVTARAFQQCKDSQLDRKRVPDFDEAFFHFNRLTQFQSMTEAQRERQSIIDKMWVENGESKLLKQTCVPPHNQLGRHYGSSGKHSMWNNLPAPKAVDVGGVAYVSPRAIVTFMMANGILIDDMKVTYDDEIVSDDPARKVHHVSESKKVVNWMNEIRSNFYGIGNGAPKSNHGAPKPSVVICLGLSDWADAFGPSKVKNNRNSVLCKSFTISAPKHLVNATANTFPVATGLKNATGWAEVDRLFHKELEELTRSPVPIPFYNNVLKKLVPCFLRRLVVMSDKQERNSLSGTIACTSDTFRCFGVSGRLSSPICNVTKVARTVSQQKPPGFGWSERCIKQNTGSNGHLFPACTRCRKASLIKLGLDFPKQNGPCTKCANWDLLPTAGRASLNFLRHDDYPTKVVEGSPVPAPDGRDIFGEDVFLPFLSTTWGIMKQACKFAFYQANRPGRGNGWTKKQTVCYLRYCGVSNELGGQLHEAAINCRKAKQQDTIDYSNPIGIGTFTFPAVWLSTHLQLADHIEAAMHQLFLGIAKSNLELTDMWLASPESGKNLSLSGFRNARTYQGLAPI